MQKQNLMKMKPRAQKTLELSVNALRQKKWSIDFECFGPKMAIDEI